MHLILVVYQICRRHRLVIDINFRLLTPLLDSRKAKILSSIYLFPTLHSFPFSLTSSSAKREKKNTQNTYLTTKKILQKRKVGQWRTVSQGEVKAACLFSGILATAAMIAAMDDGDSTNVDGSTTRVRNFVGPLVSNGTAGTTSAITEQLSTLSIDIDEGDDESSVQPQEKPEKDPRKIARKYSLFLCLFLHVTAFWFVHEVFFRFFFFFFFCLCPLRTLVNAFHVFALLFCGRLRKLVNIEASLMIFSQNLVQLSVCLCLLPSFDTTKSCFWFACCQDLRQLD